MTSQGHVTVFIWIKCSNKPHLSFKISFRVLKMVSNCLTRTCNTQSITYQQKHIDRMYDQSKSFRWLHHIARGDGFVLGAKTYHLVFRVHNKFPHLFQGSQPAVPVILPRHPPQKIGEPRLLRMSLRSVWEEKIKILHVSFRVGICTQSRK